jgi:hypothetical protein
MYGMDMRPDLLWVTAVEIDDGCDLQIGCERETKGVCILLCERDQGEACERDGGGREGGSAVRERLEGGFVVLYAKETRRWEGVSMCVVSFGKWFMEKKFRKPFSFFFFFFSLDFPVNGNHL